MRDFFDTSTQDSKRWRTCRRAKVECAGCKKMDTCTVSPDGTAFKCWRNGGELVYTQPFHKANGNGHAPKPKPKPPADGKTFETIDAAMTAISATLKNMIPSTHDLEVLHAAGWDDEAAYIAITVCALFNFYNRWIDASGVHALSDEAHREGGKRTAQHGYVRK